MIDTASASVVSKATFPTEHADIPAKPMQRGVEPVPAVRQEPPSRCRCFSFTVMERGQVVGPGRSSAGPRCAPVRNPDFGMCCRCRTGTAFFPSQTAEASSEAPNASSGIPPPPFVCRPNHHFSPTTSGLPSLVFPGLTSFRTRLSRFARWKAPGPVAARFISPARHPFSVLFLQVYFILFF